MKVGAVLVGAGEGKRFSSATPKQYLRLGHRTIFEQAMRKLAECDLVHKVLPVIHKSLIQTHEKEVKFHHSKLLPWALGSGTRQKSVLAGLRALKNSREDFDAVLVHDACRPFITQDLIRAGLAALEHADCAVPILPVNDSLLSPKEGKYFIRRPENLYKVQTPQFFRLEQLLKAHEMATSQEFLDDASLIAHTRIKTFPGEVKNIKITHPEDLGYAMDIADETVDKSVRVGTGIDFHRLQKGIPLVLCGVKIPYPQGLAGHSDGDAGLHSLSDAILGACAEGDIGSHFPSEEDKWKGADSTHFLEHTLEVLKERGGVISHIDLTIICQKPSISPHRQEMRRFISKVTKVGKESISVKATTTDYMGFLGRGEGIGVLCTVTILL